MYRPIIVSTYEETAEPFVKYFIFEYGPLALLIVL